LGSFGNFLNQAYDYRADYYKGRISFNSAQNFCTLEIPDAGKKKFMQFWKLYSAR
jgi:hypothetical protein